jgi:hypothetical protein
MKLILSLIISSILLIGCASNYKYQSQNDPKQWEGRNIAALQQQWGQADQVMHTRVGTSFYVYSVNSTSNFFNSTTSNFGMYGSGDFVRPNYANNMTMQCTTVFKTDATGKIVEVRHQGNNCGGQWVSKRPVKS